MTSQRTKRLALASTVLLTLIGAARISWAGGEHGDDQLISEARQVIANYKQTDPGLNMFFQHAAGYVVFPGIGKGGYVVGGAHGTGVVFQKGVPVGKATLNQVTVGPQIGGQEFSQVIFFETPQVLADFKRGKVELSASASAVALNQGAAAVARYKNGVAIFTQMKGGLMAEASVGGQKFSYEPLAVTR